MKTPFSPHRAIDRRLFLQQTTSAWVAASLARLPAQAANGPLASRLGAVQHQFTFAIIADTHVHARDSAGRELWPQRYNEHHLARMVTEINARQPEIAFVAHVGDVVGAPRPEQFEHFRELVKPLRPPLLLTHGNHDGKEPWTGFRETQEAVNGIAEVRYSFDCGGWHFVSFPCGFPEGGEFERDLLRWLKDDLAAHREKPTVVFEHYHLLPQGLTQLEFYTYRRELRGRLLRILAEAGNVRYVFCGHVHNGIQTSVKTAWSWRGIRFVTTPTCVPPRNFGEEYPTFARGQPQGDSPGGGYYLLCDVDGEQLRIRGRLAGVDAEHGYAEDFRPYEGQEPLWWENVTAGPPGAGLVNGGFERGLDGWASSFRYLADHDPGFVSRVTPDSRRAGSYAARLQVKEKGRTWARDEILELGQLVRAPRGPSPRLSVSYLVPEPDREGGGFVRLTGMSGASVELVVLLHWGTGDPGKTLRMSRHSSFVTGAPDLKELGARRRALFLALPGEPGPWRDIRIDLAGLFDQVVRRPGGYAQLAIDRLHLGLGVWCLSEPGSRSTCCFDAVALEDAAPGAGGPITVNGAPIGTGNTPFSDPFARNRKENTEE